MGKFRSHYEKAAYQFLFTASVDYKAARVLLLNDEPFNGIITASTCIERYIKSILAIHHKLNPVHLDKIKKLKKELNKINIPILDEMDQHFLELLSVGYELRYLDKFNKQKKQFGFFINQILAELDEAASKFEHKINFRENGEKFSQYQIYVDKKDPKIWENNFILNEWDKAEFMTRKSKMFGFLLENSGIFWHFLGQGKPKVYNGKITITKNIDIKRGNSGFPI